MTESVEARFSTFVPQRYGCLVAIIHQPWRGMAMAIDAVMVALALPVNQLVPLWDDREQDGEMVVQGENGVTDFHALRSAIYTAPHRIVLFAFDLLHFNGQDLRGCPLLERLAVLRKLIKPDPRSPIQFSDHLEGDGARFLRPWRISGLRASYPSELPAGIAADHPAHGSRPRTWWRANSSCSAPSETQTACPGRCWHQNGMAGLSLLARLF